MAAGDAAAFLDRIETDEALAEELGTLRHDRARVHARMRELGFDTTPEEVRTAFLERYGAELDEPQLAAIAGGLTDEEVFIVFGSALGGTLVLGAAAAAAAF